MNSRELHVPRYRGQATEPMGLYVAEDDHDRVVALLQAEVRQLWSEREKFFKDSVLLLEQRDSAQYELTKARELIRKAHDVLLWDEKYPTSIAKTVAVGF